MLRSNETADEYEADFLRCVKPHANAVKQRSQRINLAMKRTKDMLGGKIPQLFLATLLSLVHQDLAGSLQLVLLHISRHQPRHVDTQSVDRFPRVENHRVSFPLDKDLKLLLLKVMGQHLTNKEASVPTRIHQHR